MNYFKDYHIYKNPHLVTEKIDENFYAVYNPFINTNLFLSTEPIIEDANSKLLYLLRKYDMKYFNINKIIIL